VEGRKEATEGRKDNMKEGLYEGKKGIYEGIKKTILYEGRTTRRKDYMKKGNTIYGGRKN
jgi:hypothetical protein